MNKTLQYYNEQAADFVANTRDSDMHQQYAFFLDQVKSGGSILDLGCGSGRDSRYFIEHGYPVIAMDGAVELCQMAEQYIGQKVFQLTFDQISWKNEFDGVWACASLLHCQIDTLPGILQRIVDSLKKEGIMYLSFKYGDFSGWRNGRYFTDLNEERLSVLISHVPEVTVIKTFLSGDVRPERQQEQWLNILLQKTKIK